MSKRGAGVSFCFIAAFLMSIRYISAAIFGSGIPTWGYSVFQEMLKYTGNTLVILSIISLVVGIVYLIRAESEQDK